METGKMLTGRRILFKILPLPTILGKAWLVEALKKFITTKPVKAART
jgi:hypothetical protein